MRAVVQRVKSASVKASGKETGKIKNGFLVFLGMVKGDRPEDLEYMVNKITGLRAFEDDSGKMNLSLKEVAGEMLVVSQFTLLGDCRKGRRPSFTAAAEPSAAQGLYNAFIDKAEKRGIKVATGVFQTMMEVSLVNDGPVTFLLDSKKLF